MGYILMKKYICFVHITDEGSLPEMRIWYILLIKSDLKWFIHLGRSLFIYFNTIHPRGQGRAGLSWSRRCTGSVERQEPMD